MPSIALSGEAVEAVSTTTALITSTIEKHLVGKSYVERGIVGSSLAGTLSGESFSTVLAGNGSLSVETEVFPNIFFRTDDSELSTLYPVASVQRTADEIARVLRTYVSGVGLVTSRELKNPYKGPWPILIVSPAVQRVHQQFVGGPYGGLSGNPTGVFNRYAIRYVGLSLDEEIENTNMEGAQNKFWSVVELVIRALKKDSIGNLQGTVIRVADEIDAQYTEGGSQISWRGTTRIGGMIMVSVMELYRGYGQ